MMKLSKTMFVAGGAWVATSKLFGPITRASPAAKSDSPATRVEAHTLSAVTYGRDRFVAVGSSGVIITSRDGRSWTAQHSGVATNLHSVAFGDKEFIAVGDNGTVLASADGNTWTKRDSGTTAYLLSVEH